MTGDFNIRESRWDLSHPFHSNHSNSLFDISDFFSLNISNPIEYVPTRYFNNDYNTNSVLDLVFLYPSSLEFNQHCIYPNWRMLSDHAPITIKVSICKERILLLWCLLTKGSNEKKQFIEDIILIIKNLNTSSIPNAETLKEMVHRLASKVEESWQRNLKAVKFTRHSKAWWNNECWLSFDKYWAYQSLENWHSFKNTVKNIKRLFFDDKIEEIANKKCSPWELMNWVRKWKLPVIKAIQYEGCSYIELKDLWIALHNFFNSAQTREIDIHVLDDIPSKPTEEWNSFAKKKLIDVIKKCNNSSAPGLDKLIWSHIKLIIKDKDCIAKLINIVNAYIKLGYWPSYFKLSTMVIISKPNKSTYDLPKLYCLIVFLNTIRKLFEKMIGKHLQFHTTSNEFIYQSQLGSLKQSHTHSFT